MRLFAILSCLLVGIGGCRSFKPSANLETFSSYFAKDNKDTSLKAGQVKVTFFGTSTLLFDDGETQLLVDGFFSRPSAFKVVFGKVESDSAVIRSVINDYHINRLRGIFVCHSHYDHAMDAPEDAKLTGAKVYGSTSTLNVCKGYGLADSSMELYEPGKEILLGRFSITVIKSKHTPPFKLLGKTNATDPKHPNITEPLPQPAKVDDYIEGGTYDIYIKYNGKCILVKPSTNYIEHALDKYPVSVLFLGCAMLGVEPDSFQNNYYKNTVVATGAKAVIPVHWDNFTKPLSQPLVALPNLGDNVDKGLRFLIEKTKQDKVELKLMQAGSSIILF